MKLNKEQQKQLFRTIRGQVEKKGYKIKSNTIYVVRKECFIHCDFLVVDSKKIIYRIYIKNYSYDDIFWNILHMPDNTKKSNSLRACGVFKAPSILIEKGEVGLTDNYEELSDFLIEKISKNSNEFLNKFDVDDYVINYEKGIDKEILQCLAYIHMDCVDKAKDIAQNAILFGDKGRFENQGKGFFEWINSRD